MMVVYIMMVSSHLSFSTVSSFFSLMISFTYYLKELSIYDADGYWNCNNLLMTCPSVAWLVGLSVGRSSYVSKRWKVSNPCSYPSTCLPYKNVTMGAGMGFKERIIKF